MFYNRELAGKLNNFNGLYHGNIHPTDIDAVFEYHGKVWVLWEMKSRGKAVPTGQRIVLERMVDALCLASQYAIALVVEHGDSDQYDQYGDVLVANGWVTRYYYNGAWYEIKPVRVKELWRVLIETWYVRGIIDRREMAQLS